MINKRRYIIDYAKFVVHRIPFEIRFDDVIAYASKITGPVVRLYNDLLIFRDSILYKLTITPQVVYLEKMLNDRYDTSDRRIYIVDGKEYESLYLYVKDELKPVALYRKSESSKPKRYLYRKGEGGVETFDFVVMIPAGLDYNANELLSLVNAYKLAGKKFTIQNF